MTVLDEANQEEETMEDAVGEVIQVIEDVLGDVIEDVLLVAEFGDMMQGEKDVGTSNVFL